jgi:hypothetical protein
MSVIEKKILSLENAYSKPSIIIKSPNLHIDNIREAVGEVPSYHEKD